MHIRELRVIKNTCRDMPTVNSSINSYPVFSPLTTVPTDPHASLLDTTSNQTTLPFAQNKYSKQHIHSNLVLNNQHNRYKHQNIDNNSQNNTFSMVNQKQYTKILE